MRAFTASVSPAFQPWASVVLVTSKTWARLPFPSLPSTFSPRASSCSSNASTLTSSVSGPTDGALLGRLSPAAVAAAFTLPDASADTELAPANRPDSRLLPSCWEAPFFSPEGTGRFATAETRARRSLSRAAARATCCFARTRHATRTRLTGMANPPWPAIRRIHHQIRYATLRQDASRRNSGRRPHPWRAVSIPWLPSKAQSARPKTARQLGSFQLEHLPRPAHCYASRALVRLLICCNPACAQADRCACEGNGCSAGCASELPADCCGPLARVAAERDESSMSV